MFVGCTETKPLHMDEHNETPPHYKGAIQPIEFMRSCLTKEEFVGFCKGNVIKYIARAGKKGDAAEDVAKARQYLGYLARMLEQ